MPVTIGSNIASLSAQRQLGRATYARGEATERLSSGQRINRASDDPAGLAVATSLQTNVRVFTRGVQNLNDGVSLISIADAALESLSAITTRIQELAAQGANGVYSSKQRAALHREAVALVEEYQRIADGTTFNGVKLLDGSVSDTRLQGGYGVDGGIAITIDSVTGSAALSQHAPTGTFTPVGTFATGLATGNSFAGDFNGDGLSDLITLGTSGSVANVFLSNGDGTFVRSATFSYAGSYDGLSVSDLDGDGDDDVVYANAGSPASIFVLLGNGNGTFAAGQSYGAGTYESYVTVVDVDNDGIKDIVSVYPDIPPGPGVLKGNGDGTFQAYAQFAPSLGVVKNITFGDLNNDSITDLVFNTSNEYYVRLGAGGGSFAAATSFSAGTAVTGSHLVDLNGDGNLDIVSGGFLFLGATSFNWSLGNGDGTFAGAQVLGPGIANEVLSVGDYNRDGYGDVLVSTATAVRYLYGSASGTPTVGVSAAFTGTARPVAFDYDGDGVLDLAVGDSGSGSVQILQGDYTTTALIEDIDLRTADSARASLEIATQVADALSGERGRLGAYEARLRAAITNLKTASENSAGAAARITDADVSQEVADHVRTGILQQTVAAVLAQANLQPQLALQLLTTGETTEVGR